MVPHIFEQQQGAAAGTAGANRVFVGNTVVATFNEPIPANRLQDIASREGIRRFTAEDMQGRGLIPADFPYNGDVKLLEYNAAKTEA